MQRHVRAPACVCGSEREGRGESCDEAVSLPRWVVMRDTHGGGNKHTAASTHTTHTIFSPLPPEPEPGGRGKPSPVVLLPFRGALETHQCLQVHSIWTCSHHRASRAEIMKGWPSGDAGTREG